MKHSDQPARDAADRADEMAAAISHEHSHPHATFDAIGLDRWLRKFVHHQPGAVFVRGPQGMILAANEKAEQLLGRYTATPMPRAITRHGSHWQGEVELVANRFAGTRVWAEARPIACDDGPATLWVLD